MKQFFQELRADIVINGRDRKGAWATHPGVWAAATYRVGRAAHRVRSTPARAALLTAHRVLSVPWRLFRGVHIPHNADIGPGLRLPHPQNIVLPPDGRFGSDCSIYQDVTVGRGPVGGVPTAGDRVMLYPGARVLGGIALGDDVQVGANAVVVRDVPAGALVSAAPSRVIPAQTAERMAAAPRREARPREG